MPGFLSRRSREMDPHLEMKRENWGSSLLRASVRNPAHGKGHEEGSPTKRKGMIWLQGFPLSFPEHVPPKTRVGLILLYCAFHSSDTLWKKLT